MNFLPDIFMFLSSVSPVLGIGLLVWYARRFKQEHYTMFLLFFILLVAAIIDLSSFFINDLAIKRGMVNLYFPFAFILIAKIYLEICSDKLFIWIVDAIGLMLLVFIANSLVGQPISSVQNISWAICCFCGTVLSFLHLREFIADPPIYATRHPLWWFSTGVFIYSFLSFWVAVFTPMLMEMLGESFEYVWMFHNFNNIFKNGCFAAAIYWAYKRNPNWDEGYRPK